MYPYGFHNHKVITGTEGIVNIHGAYKMVEVTSATDTLFYPNAFSFTEDGALGNPRQSDGIPLTAGITKAIPMALYNFKADAEVTIVAYGA